MPESIRKYLVPSAIGIWVLVTLAAFWKYEYSYLFPVHRPVGAALADSTGAAKVVLADLNTSQGQVNLVSPGHPVLINFWNPQCLCSNFMEHHVRDLMNRYEKRGVKFVTVIVDPQDDMSAKDAIAKWTSRGFPQDKMPWVFDTGNTISKQLGVWAAPAAVVVDAKGHVAYIGAYNVSRFCDSDDTAFAQKALVAVMAGNEPKIHSLPFYGCQITAHAVTPKV